MFLAAHGPGKYPVSDIVEYVFRHGDPKNSESDIVVKWKTAEEIRMPYSIRTTVRTLFIALLSYDL